MFGRCIYPKEEPKKRSVHLSLFSLCCRSISGCPGIVGGRQHELLHVTSPDAHVAAVEDGQHHRSVEQFGKWLVEVVRGAVMKLSVSGSQLNVKRKQVDSHPNSVNGIGAGLDRRLAAVHLGSECQLPPGIIITRAVLQGVGRLPS